MKFYNRKEELELLGKAVKKSPSFIVVRGRRRVGKTALILKVLEENKGIYLYVDDKKNEKELLREFEQILKKELALPQYVKIDNWESLYEIIFSHGRIFAFDEFQRILNVNPSAINQLQKYWDTKGINSKTCLILSGSNVGMVKKIFMESGAPLFKRATHELALRSFSFEATREMLRDLGMEDTEEQMRAHAIAGGIPYYCSILQGQKAVTFEAFLDAILLNKLSPLKNEARETMVESFGKDHPSYYAVVNAIAMGKSSKKEIADFAGIEATSIYPYLYDLRDLTDLIEYQVPITEEKPWKSRNGRFVLKDGFFRFWFTYIFKNMSWYEEGNFEGIKSEVSRTFEGFFGFSFERIAKEFLEKLNSEGKLPAKFSKVGGWWNRKGEDIDIVLLADDAIMLVECKWGKNVDGKEILGKLKMKEALLLHKKQKVYYAVVARGFKIKPDNAFCFDINDIGRELK